MNTYLFIGGCADGKRRRVPGDAETEEVTQMRQPVTAQAYQQGAPINTTPRISSYRRHTLYFGTYPRMLYVEKSISENRMIDLLIEGYRKS